MRSSGKTRTRAAAAVTAAALSLVPVPAAADDSSSPVEVTVRGGQKQLREGGTTSWTITLRNRTSRELRGLTVAQVMPASFHPSATEPEATVKPTEANWTTDLPAQASQEFRLEGELGTVAEQDAGHAARPAAGAAGEHSGSGGGRTARVSTSVCVQEPVTVDNSGSVGAGRGNDGGNGKNGQDGKNTVGRILTCDSAAGVLRASVAPRESGHSWLYGSIGTVLLLAGGAGFALYHRRTREPVRRGGAGSPSGRCRGGTARSA